MPLTVSILITERAFVETYVPDVQCQGQCLFFVVGPCFSLLLC